MNQWQNTLAYSKPTKRNRRGEKSIESSFCEVCKCENNNKTKRANVREKYQNVKSINFAKPILGWREGGLESNRKSEPENVKNDPHCRRKTRSTFYSIVNVRCDDVLYLCQSKRCNFFTDRWKIQDNSKSTWYRKVLVKYQREIQNGGHKKNGYLLCFETNRCRYQKCLYFSGYVGYQSSARGSSSTRNWKKDSTVEKT